MTPRVAQAGGRPACLGLGTLSACASFLLPGPEAVHLPRAQRPCRKQWREVSPAGAAGGTAPSSQGPTASSGHGPHSLSRKGVCSLEAGCRSVSSSPVWSQSLKDADTNRPTGGSQASAQRSLPKLGARFPPACAGPFCLFVVTLRRGITQNKAKRRVSGRVEIRSHDGRTALGPLRLPARRPVRGGRRGPSRPPASTWSPDAGTSASSRAAASLAPLDRRRKAGKARPPEAALLLDGNSASRRATRAPATLPFSSGSSWRWGFDGWQPAELICSESRVGRSRRCGRPRVERSLLQ